MSHGKEGRNTMVNDVVYEIPEMKVIRLENETDIIRTSNPVSNEENDVWQDDFFD